MNRVATALISVLALALLWVAPVAHADFAIAPGSLTVTAEEQNGTTDTQAGSHPFAYTVHFELNRDESGNSEGGDIRDIFFEAPPGLVGNPQAIPTCPRESFEAGTPLCNPSTVVGVLHAILPGFPPITAVLYNLAPFPGTPLQFGFNSPAGLFGVQSASLRTDDDYGATIASPNIPTPVTSVTATLWGIPADSGHDAERGQRPAEGLAAPQASEAPRLPFLTLPTSCQTSPQMTVKIDSLQEPGVFKSASVGMLENGGAEVPLSGCDAVPFSPAITAPPTTERAESPSGLEFELKLPNKGLLNPDAATSETEPEKTVVTLPAGVTVNPSAANGIVGCSTAQFGQANGEPGQGCPEASKVGTLVAKTPLLKEPIEGSVYLAQPHANKFGSLLALYIVASAKESGVLVKQAGLVEADPSTGQLTTTFDELPPLPYSSFELALREGPRAPLMTPLTCGELTTVARLYPFSTPGTPAERTTPFKITSGANGTGCASSEAALPAHPVMEAGTVTPIAGSYSPFVFRVSRADGEQRLASLSTTLPSGLLGKLAGIPYCSEAGIATAASRTEEGDGAKEIASPSCPAASQVGVVNVSAGAGPSPYFVEGKAYLAGPYKGAPLSLEIITPAIAGPFDLGVVAVRTALEVNPLTAQIHAVSDPLPSILHGIPLDVRSISLQMDRPEFTINPTNCEAKTVTASLATFAGGITNLSNPFAVGGCKGLDFKPTLKIFFSGQMRRAGFPAIKAVLTQPKGQNTNVASTTVILPKGMLIANAHISGPCTRVQFNSTPVPGAGCPPKSVLGTAKVWSPLLENPEEGNVYFRSNGGERQLPDLVVALRGQVPLQLVGFIDSVGRKGAEVRRVRNRFTTVPDAPVSRFELKLSGGNKGLLQNSKNLCRSQNKATFELTGQNGKKDDTEPDIQVSCPKSKKK
jgi:hypothetical protein